MKKIIHQLHLWLGLGSSIILFLVCLSGTVLTFQHEIEQFVSPEIYQVTPPAENSPLPVDGLILQLEAKAGGKVSTVVVPADKNRSLLFNVKKDPNERRGQPYYLNPYSGEVLNEPSQRPGWFLFFFRLHRWLLLEPDAGRPVVGIATIIMTFLTISGLYLWWPKSRKHLKNSLSIKFGGNLKRLNYDLHNSLGFYASGLLLIMCLTGLFWSFEWYRNIGSVLLGTKVFDRGGKPSEVIPGETKLSIEAMMKLVNEEFTYRGDIMIMLPQSPKQPAVIQKSRRENLNLHSTDRAQINPYTGEFISLERFSDKRWGEQISSLIKSLHTGEFLGGFSKILYFFTSLIGTLLPITGFFIWFNKRKTYAK